MTYAADSILRICFSMHVHHDLVVTGLPEP